MRKATELPRVRTQPDFKDKVFDACESINLKYSTVVTRLLERWLSGDVDLKMELDQQFIKAATAAFESPRGKDALKKFSEIYEPNKEYPEATLV